jgi:tetratricopeptide (TPR) repeat protein/serine/threonine protein kinase
MSLLTEEEIFNAALQIPAAEREAFLDRACQGDTLLRAAIEALLAAHDVPDSFLEAPLGEATIEQPLVEMPGTMIGPYKLLEQIGEGGFGVVFMAEQTRPVRRRVALKVLKPGMDTREVVARFEAERQALAIMDHPHIARVFDGGATPAGRPFFVMELVRGVPITEFCDQNQLTPRQRLELFVLVCQAVQHAHQKGIIHRDLKPSNILVVMHDATPVVKVIDFGIAKALGQELTDKTLFTGFAQLVGTPLYMSPEQAGQSGLDIDTRSDIYSLGVLLYELLTGTTPFSKERFKKAAYDEIRRIIREEEPPKPSTRLSESKDALPSISAQRHMEPAKLTKLVRGELDWIVMRALEKDRNRRYETANGLAMDVQRYLADEHVLACPPSAAYRLKKFARRNKGALGVAALILFFITLLGSVAGWAVRDRAARDAAAKAQRQARESEVIRERQQRESELALEKSTRQTLTRERVTLALDEARKRQQEGRWRQALDAAKRAEALVATGEGDEATHQRAREVLGDMQMLANVEEVRVRSTQNEEGFDLNVEDQGNAQAFRDYGIDIDALDREEAAARIRARPICYELAVFLDSWSHVRRRLWPRLEAEGSQPVGKDWRELLEIARAADPEPWRDKFRIAVLNDDRQALVDLAASAPVASLPAETVDRLGDALMGRRAYEEAVAFLKKGQRVHPRDYWINGNLGLSLRNLKPPQNEEAIRYFTAALALRPESAQSHSNLGNALDSLGKFDDAIECYLEAVRISPSYSSHLTTAIDRGKTTDEAIDLYRQLLKRLPQVSGLHAGLAQLLWKQKKLDEAADSFRKAIQFKSGASAHLDCNYLGSVLIEQQKYKEAADALRQAIDANPKYMASYGQLGIVLRTFEQNSDANDLTTEARDKLWADAVAQLTRKIEQSPDDASCWFERGDAHWSLGQLDKALADFSKACELNPQNAKFLSKRGYVHFQLSQHDQAVADFSRAIELAPQDASNWGGRGNAYQSLGQLEKALADCTKAVELNPKGATSWVRRGSIYAQLGKHDQALADYSQAVELAPNAYYLNVRAAAYRQLRQWDQALADYTKVIELDPDDPINWSTRGAVYSQWGQHDKAIADFSKAIELKPDDAGIRNGRASAYRALGQSDQAIADLSQAIELQPKRALFWLNRAALYARLGQRDKAASDYSKVTEFEPQSAYDWDLQAQAHLGLGQKEKALADYAKAIEQQPRIVSYLLNRAYLYDQLGQHDKAIDDYSRVIELAPQVAANWQLRGTAYSQVGQWEQALTDYTKAVELIPNSAVLRTNQGVALAQLGQWDKAAAAFEQAATLPGEYPTAWYYRAVLEIQRDDMDAYRQVCAGMLERFEQSYSVDAAYWTTWTCVLVPDSVSEWTRPLKLAEQAHAADGRSYDTINQLGTVLYRAGRFAEAAQRLSEAEAAFEKAPSRRSTIVYNRLFQAMAQHRLGHRAEATSWLEKAVRAIDTTAAVTAPDATANIWNRVLTLKLLRREAEELLAEK